MTRRHKNGQHHVISATRGRLREISPQQAVLDPPPKIID